MMSFDESGYILYPRASQTQQVPAYDFQFLFPAGALQFPSIPVSRMTLEVRRCAAAPPLALGL
jgi:hypothetical protein